MEEIDQDGIKFLEKKAFISFLTQHDEKKYSTSNVWSRCCNKKRSRIYFKRTTGKMSNSESSWTTWGEP